MCRSRGRGKPGGTKLQKSFKVENRDNLRQTVNSCLVVMGQVETLQPVEENGGAGHAWKTFNLQRSRICKEAENCQYQLGIANQFFSKSKYPSAIYAILNLK